jgi:hypothetical protein
VNRLVLLCAVTAAMSLGALNVALAQAPAPVPAGPPPPAGAAPLTLDDILEKAAEAEAAAEPSEEEAETNGLPSAPIPYGNLLSADDLDTRIRGASAAAQTLQGPLDGRWSIDASDGSPLYTFLFVDSGRANAGLEGAWRDLRGGAGLSATGVIDSVQRNGGALSAAFYPRAGAGSVSLNLVQLSDGSWSGDMSQGGERRSVRMVRAEPILDVPPMFGIAGVVSPYRTALTRPAPARRVVSTKASRAKAAKAAKGKKASAKKRTTAKKAPARKKAPVRKKKA